MSARGRRVEGGWSAPIGLDTGRRPRTGAPQAPRRAAVTHPRSGRGWVPSRARSRRPRRHAPGVSLVASGTATWWNSVSSTSSPMRARARHNDDRFTRARARLPGRPLVSTRSTSSYDSRANRHKGQDEVHDQPRRQKTLPSLGPFVLGYRRVDQLSGEHLRQDPHPYPLARAPFRHTRGNDPRNSKATTLAFAAPGPPAALAPPGRVNLRNAGPRPSEADTDEVGD